MLNLNCVICTDLFTPADDVNVTSCGHMFHITCLNKWLERSKTCPQCRNKCDDSNIMRVYFTLADLDCSRIDVGSLQEQLNDKQLQLKMKEMEFQKTRDDLARKNERIFGLLNQVRRQRFEKLKLISDQRKEVKKLREQIEAMEGANNLLKSSMREAEQILNNEKNPKMLSYWVATLKRELKACEIKKADMRNFKMVVQTNLRKEIEQRKAQEKRNSQLESENYQLLEKIKQLEATLKKNNNSNGNEKSPNKRIGLNTTYNNSSVPLPPLLMKNQENRLNNNTKTLGNKLTVLKISATKTNAGAIPKTKSDLGQKLPILKKPRMDLVTRSSSSGSTMKPLASNMVFNGFGGSERIYPFEHALNSDVVVKEKEKPAPTSSLNSRLKNGVLRNINVTK